MWSDRSPTVAFWIYHLETSRGTYSVSHSDILNRAFVRLHTFHIDTALAPSSSSLRSDLSDGTILAKECPIVSTMAEVLVFFCFQDQGLSIDARDAYF